MPCDYDDCCDDDDCCEYVIVHSYTFAYSDGLDWQTAKKAYVLLMPLFIGNF